MTANNLNDIAGAQDAGFRIQMYSDLGGRWIDVGCLPFVDEQSNHEFRIHPDDERQWRRIQNIEANRIIARSILAGVLIAAIPVIVAIVINMIVAVFF